MTLAKEIRNRVLELKEGTVVTLADFGLPVEQQPALNVTLNRLVAEGVLKRLSKGRFYRDRKSVFGTLPPNEMEVVKDFPRIRGTGTFIHSLYTNKHNIFPQELLSKCSLN